MTPEEQINAGLDQMRRGAQKQILDKYCSDSEGKKLLALLAIAGPPFLSSLPTPQAADLLRDALCIFLADCSEHLQQKVKDEKDRNDLRNN